MRKLRRITHKQNIKPFRLYLVLSESPSLHMDKIHKNRIHSYKIINLYFNIQLSHDIT